LPPILLLVSLASSLASGGCKQRIASPDECEKVSARLADLVIQREKTPKWVDEQGHLHSGKLVPPFDDKEHEQSLHDEAQDNAKQRCLKGWKREIYDCMMKAQDFDTADKCRLL